MASEPPGRPWPAPTRYSYTLSSVTLFPRAPLRVLLLPADGFEIEFSPYRRPLTRPCRRLVTVVIGPICRAVREAPPGRFLWRCAPRSTLGQCPVVVVTKPASNNAFHFPFIFCHSTANLLSLGQFLELPANFKVPKLITASALIKW